MGRRRGQAAMESLSLISFLTLTTLILTVSLLNTFNGKVQSGKEQSLESLARLVENEISLAVNAPPGYIRNISLPSRVAGENITIHVYKDPKNGLMEVSLSLPGFSRSTILPRSVYGGPIPGRNVIRKSLQGVVSILPEESTQDAQSTPQTTRIANVQLTEPVITSMDTPAIWSNATLACQSEAFNIDPAEVYTLNTSWHVMNGTDDVWFSNTVQNVDLGREAEDSGRILQDTLSLISVKHTGFRIVPGSNITCNMSLSNTTGIAAQTTISPSITIVDAPHNVEMTHTGTDKYINITTLLQNTLDACLADANIRRQLTTICEADKSADLLPRNFNCQDMDSATDRGLRMNTGLKYVLYNEASFEKVLRTCGQAGGGIPGGHIIGNVNVSVLLSVRQALSRLSGISGSGISSPLQAFNEINPWCSVPHGTIPSGSACDAGGISVGVWRVPIQVNVKDPDVTGGVYRIRLDDTNGVLMWPSSGVFFDRESHLVQEGTSSQAEVNTDIFLLAYSPQPNMQCLNTQSELRARASRLTGGLTQLATTTFPVSERCHSGGDLQ